MARAHDVSIPLWFLRNPTRIQQYKRAQNVFPYHYGSYATLVASRLPEREDVFPYHYGSYATLRMSGVSVFLKCFHTTMVLTQLAIHTKK